MSTATAIDYRVQPREMITDDQMRSSILTAARTSIINGIYPSAPALRSYGVRGSHDRIVQVRDSMVDAGELTIPAGLRPPGGRPRKGRAAPIPAPVPGSKYHGNPECAGCRREFWGTWIGGLTRAILRREGGGA